MRKYSRLPKITVTQAASLAAEEKNPNNWFSNLRPKAVQAYDIIVGRFGHDYNSEVATEVYAALVELGYKPDNHYQQFPFNNSDGLRHRLEREHRIRLARRIGLKYLPSVKYVKINPAAYLAWQEISATPAKPYGAWDGCGVWGIAPNKIDQAWYVAGCKDSQKFRAILGGMNLVGRATGRYDFEFPPVRKGHSINQTRNILRGWRWALKHNRAYRLSSKKLEVMGRVSIPLRYALMRNFTETGQLNFDFAAEVQHWTKAQKASLLSPKEAWHFLYGRCPFEGGKESPIPHPAALASWNKAAGAFAKLVSRFAPEKERENLLPIFNLCALFGSEGEVERFVRKTQALSCWTNERGTVEHLTGAQAPITLRALHDAGQFTLPRNNWTPRLWTGFCHRFPEAVRYAQHFGNVEQTGEMPTSLSQLRDVVGRFVYDNTAGAEALASACNALGLTQEQFEAYRDLTKTTKASEACPFVDVTLGGYRLYKLDCTDVRGPLLGLYTDCCQHLDGAGSACAVHGWTDPTSAFYVVEYKDKIIAQSWAWRSKESDLVFDSIEGLDGYNTNTISELFLRAANQICSRLGIARVLVGQTGYGLTSQVREYLQNNGKPCLNGLAVEMRSTCSYIDGKKQWLLYQSGEPGKFKKADVGEIGATLAINRLCDGSDVFCEYCDAEVHPNCEICPSCGENIAEWV